MKTFTLGLILLCFLAMPAAGQYEIYNGEIPDDLLIVLQRQEGYGSGRYTEISITADGEFSYLSRGGHPLIELPIPPADKKYPLKPAPVVKPKISAKRLKFLIAEFEKIQFFKFGDNFPPEEEKEYYSINHQATETIFIRINGQTKEVSNYLGESFNRTRILRDLAEKIRGAGVWHLPDGKIPENFNLSYRITEGSAVRRDVKVDARGEVVETFYSSEPTKVRTMTVPVKTETIGKLSKKQLSELIEEFEKTGFSIFNFSTLTKYDGCLNEPLPNAERRAHINVQINQIQQIYASLYENCRPQPDTDAAKFEYMKEVIEKMLGKFD